MNSNPTQINKEIKTINDQVEMNQSKLIKIYNKKDNINENNLVIDLLEDVEVKIEINEDEEESE